MLGMQVLRDAGESSLGRRVASHARKHLADGACGERDDGTGTVRLSE